MLNKNTIGLLNMSWLFHVSMNEILEGSNLIHKIANQPYELIDIAYFVPQDEIEYNI